MKNTGYFMLATMLLSMACPLLAQNKGFTWERELKTYSIGVKGIHLYDLPSRDSDMLNPDLKGLNGANTSFDIGIDMYGEKYFNPFIGIQLGFRFAKLSGANEIEYYKNSFFAIYTDAMLMLSNYNSPAKKLNTYMKAGLGAGSYNAHQYLAFDDAPEDDMKAGFWEGRLGLGANYELNSFLRLELEVMYNTAFTGGFDGYSGGRSFFPYLTTGIGFSYTFGERETRPMYSGTYYDKGSTANREITKNTSSD